MSMSNIGLVVFGNADGMNVVEEPRGFRIGESLEQTVDFAYPFRWGKEVYRAVIFEQAGNRYLFIALHTKIDDFRGSRDGAHAGAGVFIREGMCDGAIVVDVLRRMLSTLIKEASNGAQFTSKLSAIESIVRPALKVGAETLTRVWQPATVKARLAPSDVISLVDASDWRVATPGHFVEFASHVLTYERGHYLYAPDPEMRNDIPFTGKHERVSLSQRLFNLSASLVASKSRSEESMRDSQSQLRESQSRVTELGEKVTQMDQLKVQNSRIQLENKNLTKEKDGLRQENVQLEQRLAIAESKINRTKPGSGSGDGHSGVVVSLLKEIDKLKEENESLKGGMNEFKNNKEKPFFGGWINIALAICLAGLLAALGAIFVIHGALDNEEEKNRESDRKMDEKRKEISVLEAQLTNAQDEIKKLNEEIPPKGAAQPNKEGVCNAEAKELKGDKHKNFMSKCLNAKAPAPAASESGTTQQNKRRLAKTTPIPQSSEATNAQKP